MAHSIKATFAIGSEEVYGPHIIAYLPAFEVSNGEKTVVLTEGVSVARHGLNFSKVKATAVKRAKESLDKLSERDIRRICLNI